MNQDCPVVVPHLARTVSSSPQSVPSAVSLSIPRSSKSTVKSPASVQESSPSRYPTSFHGSPAGRNAPETLSRRAGGGSSPAPLFSLKQESASVPVVIS